MASNALAETNAGEVADYAGGLLSVIERAARDPNVDIDKMERLLAMQERVQERNAKAAFTEAKLAMRAELPEVTMRGHIIIKDGAGNIKQDTPFAKFEDLHDAVVPVLTRHGFDLKFRTGLSPDGKVRVTTILEHIGGHADETDFDLPHDGSGSKNAVQAVGSSTSYGKRYGTIAILNIKVAGEDDDGEKASNHTPDGTPIARRKLDGPIESKTALKAAVQALRFKVNNTPDVETLNTLLKGEKALIDQAARDWTALLDGYPNIPEDKGLRGDVAARREYFRNGGVSAFDELLTSMKGCASLAALYAWRDQNEAEVDALDGADARTFQRAWDEQETVIANKATPLDAG